MLPWLMALVVSCVFSSAASALELRTLVLDSEKMPELFVKGKKGQVALRFSSAVPSPVVWVDGSNGVTLYKKKITDGGGESYKVAYQLKKPEGAKGVLLLAWTTKGEQKFLPISDEYLNAKANEWLFINTCAESVAFRIGENAKPFVIKPRKMEVFKCSVKSNQGASVLAKASVDGEVRTIYSTYWPIYNGRRFLIIITKQGRKIKVNPIFDQILSAEQKKELRKKYENE